MDHIIPRAKGKADSEENLRILCGVHNRSECTKWGLEKEC
ncbi:MAG: HNH endonuclease [Bdellovibrionaceae bacterium]|nr:HNH endonuclease [Pseudobdellovibrionaceae bacterium]